MLGEHYSQKYFYDARTFSTHALLFEDNIQHDQEGKKVVERTKKFKDMEQASNSNNPIAQTS